MLYEKYKRAFFISTKLMNENFVNKNSQVRLFFNILIIRQLNLLSLKIRFIHQNIFQKVDGYHNFFSTKSKTDKKLFF